MSNDAAQPLFLKVLREWAPTALGILCLIVMSAVAITITYAPHGWGQHSALKKTDIAVLTTSSTGYQSLQPARSINTKPTRLMMPTIDLGIDVLDSTIDVQKNAWPLSSNNAHYANFTARLGSKKGTLLIYGHNTSSVMMPTANLSIGDQIALIDDHGQIWRFQYTSEQIVKPEEVGFIYEDVPFRVVMFTCNGWNDQYRRLMYFEPIAT